MVAYITPPSFESKRSCSVAVVSAPHPTTSSVCSVSAHGYHASVRHKAFSEGDIHIEFKSTRRYRTNNSCCRVGAADTQRICTARGIYNRATRNSIDVSANTTLKNSCRTSLRARLGMNGPQCFSTLPTIWDDH